MRLARTAMEKRKDIPWGEPQLLWERLREAAPADLSLQSDIDTASAEIGGRGMLASGGASLAAVGIAQQHGFSWHPATMAFRPSIRRRLRPLRRMPGALAVIASLFGIAGSAVVLLR